MTLTAPADGTMTADPRDPAMAPLPGEPPPDPPGRPPWRSLALVLLLAALTIAGIAMVLRSRPGSVPRQTRPVPEASRDPALAPVTALGRLEALGDTRRLAAPSGAMGQSPRVSNLLVEKGDSVRQGQLLATFDSRIDVEADRAVAAATLNTREQRLGLLRQDLDRYAALEQAGAVSEQDLEQRRLNVLEVEQQLVQARAQLRREDVRLPLTELRAPFDGTVLDIHARSGERPGEKGVLELASSAGVEAVLEVYESDIERVRPGQRVELRSENGGFTGRLIGRVLRIDPVVRQREVLATDPTANTDARIVEVRVALDPGDAARVRRLLGLKLIAKVLP